jgi:hypothetical protein
MVVKVLIAALIAATGGVPAGMAAPQSSTVLVVFRWSAAEARQGVAVDQQFFYAIDNNRIGKYEKKTGRRVAHWEGDRKLFPHINSCSVNGGELICAASNHPAVPMASAIEIFSTATLKHLRTVALPPYPGSLTWIERHGGAWYALFANYDAGHGGEPGHDHRWTLLMRLDDEFRAVRSWHFPDDLLDRFAPMSSSGGSWNSDGLLYVTGHNRPELYALRLPEAGTLIEHVATVPLPSDGQAIDWDPVEPRLLWSIDRTTRSVIASRVAEVAACAGSNHCRR